MIIDFPIEHNHRVAVLSGNGLIAVLQIDNLEARGAHRAQTGLENAQLVWPAVDQSGSGVPNAIRRWRPIFMSKANNAAQIDQSLNTELSACRD